MNFTIPVQIEMQTVQPMDIEIKNIRTEDKDTGAFGFCLKSIITDISSLLIPCIDNFNNESTKDSMIMEKELDEDNSKNVEIMSNLFINYLDSSLCNVNKESIDNYNFKAERNLLVKEEKESEKIQDSKLISEMDYNDFVPRNILDEDIDFSAKPSNISRQEQSEKSSKLAETILKNDLKIDFPAKTTNLFIMPDENIYDYRRFEEPENKNISINNNNFGKIYKDIEFYSIIFNKNQNISNNRTNQVLVLESQTDKLKNDNIFLNSEVKKADTSESNIVFKNDNLFSFEPDVTAKTSDKILNRYDIDEIKCDSIKLENEKNKEISPRNEYENKIHDLHNTIVKPNETKTIEKNPGAPEIPNIIKNSFVITKKESNFLEISLKPEGIGKLHIHLSLDNGMVHAKVDAFEIAGRDLINKNINDIVKVLLDEGINIGSFSINLKEKKGESSEYVDDSKFINDSKEKADMPVTLTGKYIINIFV